MAAKLDVTRERVRQLVSEGRIRPAPRKIPFGPKNHVYIFADHAKKVGKDGKPGRPKKVLDKEKR